MAKKFYSSGHRSPEDMKKIGSLRDVHLAAFKTITGVDPSVDNIRAIVVFNVCEMLHVIRCDMICLVVI